MEIQMNGQTQCKATQPQSHGSKRMGKIGIATLAPPRTKAAPRSGQHAHENCRNAASLAPTRGLATVAEQQQRKIRLAIVSTRRRVEGRRGPVHQARGLCTSHKGNTHVSQASPLPTAARVVASRRQILPAMLLRWGGQWRPSTWPRVTLRRDPQRKRRSEIFDESSRLAFDVRTEPSTPICIVCPWHARLYYSAQWVGHPIPDKPTRADRSRATLVV
eukprot:scaffold584_cov338-Pavlova_lutheri.AAC.19